MNWEETSPLPEPRRPGSGLDMEGKMVVAVVNPDAQCPERADHRPERAVQQRSFAHHSDRRVAEGCDRGEEPGGKPRLADVEFVACGERPPSISSVRSPVRRTGHRARRCSGWPNGYRRKIRCYAAGKYLRPAARRPGRAVRNFWNMGECKCLEPSGERIDPYTDNYCIFGAAVRSLVRCGTCQKSLFRFHFPNPE